MTSPSAIPSLRTELLVRLALLTAAAILLAVAGLVLLGDVVSSEHGTLYVGALLTADLVLVVALGAYVVQRLVVRPLTQLLSAAEAMAGGDSARRVGDTSSLEMHRLATSFNRITERRTEEQAQLVRAEKLASVGRLAAGVAHELGNPLTAITSYVHVLRGRLATSMERDIGDVLTVMERECARIDRIIRGLLDYARPRPSAATAIDVNEIIRSVVDLLAQQRALEGVQVDLELTRQELHIHGDRHDLEQLFVNLLLNAVDAMARSGRIVVRVERAARITLRQPSVRRSVIGSHPVEHAPSSRAQLWLSGHDSAEIAKIVVADSGPGVPPEIADRIFDPFFTTKQPGKGTGLGLAIVARIVDNCHGTIWVTTAREGGAAFHVLFPIAAAAVGESKAGPAPASRDERARRAG